MSPVYLYQSDFLAYENDPSRILKDKDKIKKMFSKESQAELESLFNYIETYSVKNQEALAQAQKINTDWIIGRAKYKPEANSGYEALQNAGVEGADSFLTSFSAVPNFFLLDSALFS